jgi:hypothetical protein
MKSWHSRLMRGLQGAVLLAGLALAGCTSSTPVTVVEGGTVAFRGTVNPVERIAGTTEFFVTGGGTTCSGTIEAWKLNVTASFIVRCSDGRAGKATVTREPGNVITGSGHIQFDDGRRMDVTFGPNA